MSFAYGFGLPHWHPLSGAFSPLSLFSGGVQGAWYDPSDATTLFSDRAGTTPCGTPGGGSVVPVGLMLDKSQGLVLGSDIVTNGNFTTDSNWNKGTGWAISGGAAVATATSDPIFQGPGTGTGVGTTVGKFYVATWNQVVTSGSTRFRSNTYSGNYTTTGSQIYYFLADSPNIHIYGNSFTGTIDNLVVRELPGNHAIAANDTTARPELRARVNLLTYSEQFENAAWSKSATSVAANTTATTDPLGGNTADTLTATAATNFHDVEQASITPPSTSTTYTVSFYIKKNTARYVSVGWWRSSTQAAGAGFDLDTGTITGTGDIGAGYSASGSAIQSVGNGWYRCSVVVTGSVSQQFPAVFIRSTAYTGGASTWFGETFTAAGTESVYLWGAQLTATNEFPANTYQRISDANTYDAVGFPRYLAFNGTSSAMSTPGNVNLSGTDKATVFAGVRPQVGTTQIIAELSTDASAPANNGTFYFIVSSSRTFFGSKGTTFQDRGSNAQTFPVSYVATGAGNISAPSASIRVNGTLEGTNTSSQGTGNYSSYPLFIGARNNASNFLNGNLYSLIVVGSAVSAGQISATEQWVAGKTGITI